MAVYEHDPEGYEYVLHPRQLRDGCYVRLRGESECGPRHSTFPGSGGAARRAKPRRGGGRMNPYLLDQVTYWPEATAVIVIAVCAVIAWVAWLKWGPK
jgi:hypothetical protein